MRPTSSPRRERFQELAARVVEHLAATKPADVPTLLESQLDGKTVKEHARRDERRARREDRDPAGSRILEGGYVTSYLHKTDPQLPPTVGVLVQLDKPNAQVGKDIAQHTAAMAPKYLSPDEVPAEVVEKERGVFEQMTREEGKPRPPSRRSSRVGSRAWFSDFTLLEQACVKDNKKTIRQVAEEAGVKVLAFTRYRVDSRRLESQRG